MYNNQYSIFRGKRWFDFVLLFQIKKTMKIYHLLILLIISVSCSTSNVNNKIYWVNSSKVSCTGVGPMQCYSVQNGDTLNWQNWQNFYSGINGFEFEPGYIYKLLIKEKTLSAEDVPADASSITYTLVKILEKKADSRLQIIGLWILESMDGKNIQLYKTNTH